jgi:phage shock protein A
MTKVKTVKANPVKKKLTAEEVNQLIDEALESFSEAMYEEFEEMQKLIDEMRERLGFVE